ncbi:MAG: hypothetical protein IJ736_12070, partial [Firmicutes bacterium]|nr:hypothetical protein [Bacillota bacterium]
MKKNRRFWATALIMTAALSCTAYAQSKTVNLQIGNAKMTVNGEVSELDSPPVIIDSRTLVPIRAIVEALDGEVDWDNATKTATLKNGEGDVVKLTINSRTASYNGTQSELDTPPVIINERTMLPIRFVAESFGYKTDWNAADKTITISNGEIETKAGTKKTSFDLSGHTEEHLASDKDGNEYISFFNEDDMYDKYIVIKDKTGNDKGTYKLTYAWGNVYKDNSGNTFVLVYDSNEEKYSAVINGTEKELVLNDEYYPVDEEGNVYDNSNGEKLSVKDKNGNVIATYSDTGEAWEIYEDEGGNMAYNVHRRDSY